MSKFYPVEIIPRNGGDCADDEVDSPIAPPANPQVDFDRIRRAVREILIAVGEDPDREGLQETPDRVAPDMLPAWLGREVTGEVRYSNASLALNGYPERLS